MDRGESCLPGQWVGEVSPTDQEHRYPSDNGMRQAKCLQQVEQVRACLDQDGAILIHVFAPERHPLRPRVAESLQLKAPLALIWWKSLIVRKLDLPLA